MKAEDDCQPVDTSVSFFNNEAQCTSDFSIAAVDQVCGHRADSTVTLKVDSEPPEVRCFINNHNLTNNGDDSYESIDFEYAVIDNCDSDVDVKVEVYSNELDDNFHKMAFISKEAESIIVKSSACGQDE